ncbi:unnamed protein product [Fasciola hepatica]|uniref:Uncharacterized protein n=1 Tax=Fasciola hepatica TaxID=6192 RepID=A0ABC9HHY9_FASHE
MALPVTNTAASSFSWSSSSSSSSSSAPSISSSPSIAAESAAPSSLPLPISSLAPSLSPFEGENSAEVSISDCARYAEVASTSVTEPTGTKSRQRQKLSKSVRHNADPVGTDVATQAEDGIIGTTLSQHSTTVDGRKPAWITTAGRPRRAPPSRKQCFLIMILPETKETTEQAHLDHYIASLQEEGNCGENAGGISLPNKQSQ